MLFISYRSNATEAKDYFTRDLARADYYLRDAPEIAGRWHGLGAELLGLTGEVKQEDFFALCDNLNPATGARLTARTKADRRVLYDFTFDAPKSVTLAYEIGRDERIRASFEQAVAQTMASMEAAVMARVRKGGEDADRATANMIWASFVHRTTRPVEGMPDPQLHCHAIVFNATFDMVEDRWKAAQLANLVRDKGYYQAEFHSRFAKKLAGLGYGIERDGNSFRLGGISRAVADKFSRRTEIIEAEAARLEITDAKAKGELGRRTREKKDEQGKSVSELRREWEGRLNVDESGAIATARQGYETKTLGAAKAMDYALSHCFERASVVSEKELLKTALIQSVGHASVEQIKGESMRDDVLRRERDGQRWVTTKDVLREEIAMTAFAREGRGRHRKLGGEAPRLDPKLSGEQRRAALVILKSRDTVTGLIGSAGTGKTRMMQATVAAIEAAGKQVYAFAPSAEASRGVLRQEGFKNAETVERLLSDAQLQRTVQGQVLWVDEAGLLSVRDMKRLFDVAKEQQCRVVLAGDAKQHFSVQRGDALRLLERDAGMKFAELRQVRRQTNESYRQAVCAISEGDRIGKDGRTRLEAGIGMLDKMGAIVEAEGEERLRRIADDYVKSTAGRRKDGTQKTALVVSPTHREGEKVTEAIRENLKASGRLARDERGFLSLKALNLTEAQRTDALNYRAGDVVQFVQNAKGYRRGERATVKQADSSGVIITRGNSSIEPLPLHEAKKFQVYEPGSIALAQGDRLRITQNGFTGPIRRGQRTAKARLNNGAMYEVAGFTREGDIRLGNGFVVPKDYGGIAHGYLTTSHASQGKTVDAVLIALGSESFAAANRQQFYVSVSRGREAVQLYTDDKAALMDAVKANAARISASELMEGAPAAASARTQRLRRVFDMQRIQRAYGLVRERMAARAMEPRREGLNLGGR